MKLFFGPMSKNVIDCVIQYNEFGLIPSRRQVDFQGGYVNGFTQQSLRDYVGDNVLICRDHGGEYQGSSIDTGIQSFDNDCRQFDIIHIDPWKCHQEYELGLASTISHIKRCYKQNPNVKFEVGTEEAIRPFSSAEIECLLFDLKKQLTTSEFKAIEYVVVQGGVGLDLPNRRNTGQFKPQILKSMIDLCHGFGKKAKEHNGDYLDNDAYVERMKLGLDALNIAPEIAQIETKAIYDTMNIQLRRRFETYCIQSGAWTKWADDSILNSPEKVVITCGHYLFSDPEFIKTKNQLFGIDKYINECIIAYLDNLYAITKNNSV